MKRSNKDIIKPNKTNSSNDEDSDLNNENYKGFAFLPNSKILFFFDLFLIIADLYTFLVIPLSVAQNKDIREKSSLFKEIIHYFIDLIFLFDFIISFFRGYYNYEMELIRNNQKIIKHYLKH